jgi:hypothetical protein
MATLGSIVHTSNEDADIQSLFTCSFAHLLEDQDVGIAISRSECSELRPLNSGDFLPPEIFIEIFRLCCNDLKDGRTLAQNDINPEIINGPWNLSQVCARWRALCLSTASLWTTITLCSKSGEVRDIHPSLGAVALLEEGLRRCRTLTFISQFKDFSFKWDGSSPSFHIVLSGSH